MQEFDRADELYQAGMKVDSANANLLVHRGLVTLQAKGDIAKAVKLFDKAIPLANTDLEMCHMIGLRDAAPKPKKGKNNNLLY